MAPPGMGLSQATSTITASLTGYVEWSVEIRNSSNQHIKTFSSDGIYVSVPWNGKDISAQIVPDGTYTWTIRATDPETGISATPVSGTVKVDWTEPSGSIAEPIADATVSETVSIKGLANDANFSAWVLYYGTGISPTSWSSLVSSSQPAVLDIFGFPPTGTGLPPSSPRGWS